MQTANQTHTPFTHLAPSPANHFGLLFYGAVLRITEEGTRACGSMDALFLQFSFLAGYWEELARHGLGVLPPGRAGEWWSGLVAQWENLAECHLPLAALRAEGRLSHEALLLLLMTGLPLEDSRFGLLFEYLQGIPGGYCPVVGLAATWWSADNPGEARTLLRQLLDRGLLQVVNPEAPPGQWVLQPPAAVWDAIRGESDGQPLPWVRYHSPSELPMLDSLILPHDLLHTISRLPPLLEAGEAQAVIVRGHQHNGRRTLLHALAGQLGRGVLAWEAGSKLDETRWRQVGPLAVLLHAFPIVVLDLGPGETVDIPPLPSYRGPIGIVLGKQGGVNGTTVQQALTLSLQLPDPTARAAHWRHSLPDLDTQALSTISERFRLTAGNIHRVAPLARSYAALDGRSSVSTADVQQAARTLNRQGLDTLATHVPTSGTWKHLAVSLETREELSLLERRCLHRERLPALVGSAFGSQLGAGVRALFSGPSGTGKTLAARLLAASLQMDLYRLDLASVVNKYIGETEKNLDQAFARAEELDVILLLDEGDALLTQRTSVHSSNDRYANLETNYLLQRLESFEGILVVTSNASQRIDEAFQRRMDVVITFHQPDAAERESIWQMHLPDTHVVPASYASEVARRCALSGGQIRNAALHASLLALNDDAPLGSVHLEAAVRREYRKTGAVCPLRPHNGAVLQTG